MPNPNGPLSIKISLRAIKFVNAKMSELKDKPGGRWSSPILHSYPSTKIQSISKRAAEHGVTAFIRYFAKKYLKLSLKETAVRKPKNLYISLV